MDEISTGEFVFVSSVKYIYGFPNQNSCNETIKHIMPRAAQKTKTTPKKSEKKAKKPSTAYHEPGAHGFRDHEQPEPPKLDRGRPKQTREELERVAEQMREEEKGKQPRKRRNAIFGKL